MKSTLKQVVQDLLKPLTQSQIYDILTGVDIVSVTFKDLTVIDDQSILDDMEDNYE